MVWKPKPVPWDRLLVTRDDHEEFEIDIKSYPSYAPSKGCVLLLAGVGGSSQAPYIEVQHALKPEYRILIRNPAVKREAQAWTFLKNGWSVAVLVPRGLGDVKAACTPPASTPTKTHNAHPD